MFLFDPPRTISSRFMFFRILALFRRDIGSIPVPLGSFCETFRMFDDFFEELTNLMLHSCLPD